MTMTRESDRAATAEMMQPPSDTVPTLSRCCCLNACFIKFQGWFWLIWKKKIPEQKLKNTGAKYAVTISGGRQRHNTSTRESLSGANVLQQAAARSINTVVVLLWVQVRTAAAVEWYVPGMLIRRITRVHTAVRKYEEFYNIFKNTKWSLHFRTNWYMM